MNNQTYPLSDAAYREWVLNQHQGSISPRGAWKEARRRATEERDAALESLHVYYRAEIKWLRDLSVRLVYSLEDLHFNHRSVMWQDGCPICDLIKEARTLLDHAALEGKE